MKNLLYKEFKLCMTAPMLFFYAFVCMLLIPSYPYTVAAFFICNGLYFTFSQAAADNDLLFTTLLPVSKADAVKGKLWFVVIMQGLFLLLCVPMILLGNRIHPDGNPAGADCSLTLLGGMLVLFAIFNAIFLPRYFRESHKSGKHFLIALIGVFLWVTVFEGILIASSAAGQYIPFFGWIRDNLDAFPKTPGAWTAQGILLAVCALLYAGANLLTYQKAARNFNSVDL